jgi:hypothetical protein
MLHCIGAVAYPEKKKIAREIRWRQTTKIQGLKWHKT